MAEFRIVERIEAIGREAWNACFAGELEDFDYLRASEEAGIVGFRWCYIVAETQGTVCAIIPAFLNQYALDTTLEGKAKKISSLLRQHFPSALTLKLACIGSPVLESGRVGFHASVATEQRGELLAGMLQMFERFASDQGYSLIGLKDIPDAQSALWNPLLAARGYQTIPGMPSATLAIDFSTIEEYFTRLSAATRKDMRRKLKAREGVRIEHRTAIDDVLPEIMALYRETRSRSDLQFEELTPEFFSGVLRQMPGRAFFTLYYVGDELLAANLLLRDGTTLLDKFFCMNAERGRAHNLYFISWFTNLEYCLEQRLSLYQSGQAGYTNKLRLGSSFEPTFMHFKHRNRWINGALRFAAPMLAGDPMKEAA